MLGDTPVGRRRSGRRRIIIPCLVIARAASLRYARVAETRGCCGTVPPEKKNNNK